MRTGGPTDRGLLAPYNPESKLLLDPQNRRRLTLGPTILRHAVGGYRPDMFKSKNCHMRMAYLRFLAGQNKARVGIDEGR